MELFSTMTTYDFVVLGIILVLMGRGIYLGFLKQVTSLVALYLGYFAASHYSERLLPLLRDISDNPKVVFLATCVILFAATYIVVMLLGKVLGHVISMTVAGWFDRLLGGVVGIAKALILVVLMHIILGTLLAPENRMLKTCASCEALGAASDFSRSLIASEDVRKSFLQKEPAISLDAVREYMPDQMKSQPQTDDQLRPNN